MTATAVPKEETGFGTLLLPLLIAQLLVTADLTCMNSLNSTIAHDLGSSLTGITTVISLSLLVAGALIVPASRIGGRRGHARVLALGAAFLVVGDAVTALSPSLQCPDGRQGADRGDRGGAHPPGRLLARDAQLRARRAPALSG